MPVSVSATFQRQAFRAILSILLFLLLYIILFCSVLLLTIAAAYGGLMLIVARPGTITIMVGGGLIGMAFFILYFIIKFLFSRNKFDRSSLLEINDSQEPELFALIRETAAETGSPLPKRVYLAADVNASVFYDSSFWSMVLPIRKNLLIGLGLVNSVSVSELKAIIAHEFGHFSQRSMKIGSYVYQVNRVIHNMLFDNDAYGRRIGAFASVSSFFSFFATVTVKIVSGIQWILRKMYGFVNENYMALSREMEFHADEVAAHAAGSEPLASSLMRMELAEHAFSATLEFYGSRIADNVVPYNMYDQHGFVMTRIANEKSAPFRNGLPDITLDFMNRFNYSRLVIKNQWASHPETGERVERLQSLGIQKEQDPNSAWGLFSQPEKTQLDVTRLLFSQVEYSAETIPLSSNDFENNYISENELFRQHRFYNGYYDNRTLSEEDFQTVQQPAESVINRTPDTVFSAEIMEHLAQLTALRADIEILEKIAEGDTQIKTFDYDGQRFAVADTGQLLERLRNEEAVLEAELRKNDTAALAFFHQMAANAGNVSEWHEQYSSFFKKEKQFNAAIEESRQFMLFSNFMTETQTFDFIEARMEELKQMERPLKERMRRLFEDQTSQQAVPAHEKKALDKYLACEWTYFIRPDYYSDAIDVLSQAIYAYNNILTRNYYMDRKRLLDWQAEQVTQPVTTSLETSTYNKTPATSAKY